ncbi:transglutaminase family protein [Cerasicoccus arenae]|uniref:Transglutaminase n=1 Tax=Cerasicoccus arenae TaxID=424488 RepID=A0A8J3DFD6_9BACT|nr:transglutaminase family protein [Cerasicoccus arenae]MBK1859458.1 transglutaminase family protein [Cerasicoccus arenae]GHC13677.1 transglutaminase [Cerasicoccus arenae]
MRFHVTHTTQYEYAAPASESFAELRVWPIDTNGQKVIHRELVIEPEVRADHYVDYFGNHVEFFSIPFRHSEVRVKSLAEVETFPNQPRPSILGTPVGEARQIYNSKLFKLFEYLQPTELVPLMPVRKGIRKCFFHESDEIGPALVRLNEWIFKRFDYKPGTTDISTPLTEVIKNKRGVCQDFAHLMLAILRNHGLPARYVSGYIEAFDPEKTDPNLIGAAASHAWVEVFLPGGFWWGLDPTNNQVAGERHVKVAVGRDYNDVAPMRGTYKGALDQRLQVMVSLKRTLASTL